MTKWTWFIASAVVAAASVQAASAADATSVRGNAQFLSDPSGQALPDNLQNISLGMTGRPQHAGGPTLKADPAALQGQSRSFNQGLNAYDPNLGRRTFLSAGAGVQSRLQLGAYRAGEGAEAYARAYLIANARQLNLVPRNIDDARLVFLHDRGTGPVIARFQQVVDGMDVVGRYLNVMLDRDNQLVAISGYFASAKSVASSNQIRSDFAQGAAPAVSTAFQDLNLPFSGYNLYAAGTKNGYTYLTGNLSNRDVVLDRPVRVRKLLFPVAGKLVPGWYVEVHAGNKASRDGIAYGYVIAAADQKVLFRKNLTAQEGFDYRVYADAASKHPMDSPAGNDLVPNPNGDPTPVTESFVSAPLVSVESTVSTGDPWLPAGANVTTGNNVDAYVDISGSDGFDASDFRAATTSANTFDYTNDLSLQPTTSDNRHAAIVNLFYLNNWLHDFYYDAGFDEAAGNAQMDNFGRGGEAGDPIHAEAQDFSGRNNANMSTPPDGMSPRMQMYVFDGPVTSKSVTASSTSGANFTFDPAAPSSFGPSDFNVTGDVVIYNDGDTSGGGIDPQYDACQATSQDLTGKIALIADIYTCNFTVKVKNAQNAGAIGALVVYNGAPNPDQVFAMGGTDPSVTIPSLGVSDDDADPVISDINSSNTVSLTMQLQHAPDRDGALDTGIVAHEFYHYVSNRLVGDALGLVNLQGAGMGEGWSDVSALLTTVSDSDLNANPDGIYSVGGFATDDYFYAVRRMPYSTNMNINPLTFADIEQGVALPSADFPYAYGANGSYNNEVHSIGEIWASALWEGYVGLIETGGYTPAEARSRMKAYVIEGLMMTPNSPTMIEARNGILAAVKAQSESDYQIFVTAFAKRGMGFIAIAPPRDSTSLSGVTESFETDNQAFTVESAKLNTNWAAGSCDIDNSIDPGESGQITIGVQNIGSADLTGVTAQLSSDADISFANGGLVTFDTVDAVGAAVQAKGAFTLNSATAVDEPVTVHVSFPEMGANPSDVAEPAAFDLGFEANLDLDKLNNGDDMETRPATLTDWSLDSTEGSTPFQIGNDDGYNSYFGLPSGNHYWLGADNGMATDNTLTTPSIQVGSDPFSISFFQYYQFESDNPSSPTQFYDGGVLEINVDGAGWQDVTAAGGTFSAGYNGVITPTGYGNPLEGRNAFVNSGGGTTENLSFGTALAGSTVQFRFRIGTDAAAGDLGWLIDDFQVTGAAQPPFSKLVAPAGGCDLRPVANAGEDRYSYTGYKITLDGSGSTDNSQIVSYAWTQTAGASVNLEGANTPSLSFTAPAKSGTLTFMLTVTDDTGQTSSDSAVVKVNKRRFPPPGSQGGSGGGSTGLLGLLTLLGLLGLRYKNGGSQ